MRLELVTPESDTLVVLERPNKPNAIIVDIDGTVADISHRLQHIKKEDQDWDSFYALCTEDKPIPEMVELVTALNRDNDILFLTGRNQSTEFATRKWLREHFPFYWVLFMPRGREDYGWDKDIKRGCYLSKIAPLYNVKMVLEDRDQCVKMWRGLGLRTLQVTDGDF